MLDRRQFVTGVSVAAAWAADTPRPLRILLLGGTRFIGVPIMELALRRGHTLTFFNRGRTNPDLFPQVERIKGDRHGPLDALQSRRWDAVIDTSAYVPRAVKMTAELLAPNVGQYLFVSSSSTCPAFGNPNAAISRRQVVLPALRS